MLGVYILFLIYSLFLGLLSNWLPSGVIALGFILIWVVYLYILGHRTIPRRYRFALPWGIGIISIFGILAIFDIHLPHLGLWGMAFLISVIFYHAAMILGADYILRAASSSAHLWFVIHNLLFIFGLGWFVVFDFWNLLFWNVILLMGGFSLYMGLSMWNKGTERSIDVVDSSAVILLSALYFIVIALLLKLAVFMHLDIRVFISAMFGVFAGLAVLGIFWGEGIKRAISEFWRRLFGYEHYDINQEWDDFVSSVEDVMDDKIIVEKLNSYLRDRFNVLEALVYWKERDGHYVSITSKEQIDLSPEAEKWFLLKDSVVYPDELWRHNIELPLKEDNHILCPMIFQRQLTGLLILRLDSRRRIPTELIYVLARNLSMIITIARISEELFEARQFEQFNKMVSFIVHDMKNALSSISLLLDNWQKNKTNPEFIDDAYLTLTSVMKKIEQMLLRLRIYRNSEKLSDMEIERCNLSRIVELALENTNLKNKIGLEIDVNLPPSIEIDFNCSWLEKIFENLLINAADAIEKDGRIDIWLEEYDLWYKVYVRDTGCGMSQEFIERDLFRPFVSTKKAGLGIGMYEVKNIMEQFGGRIEVLSQPGQGTEVVLYFRR